MSNDTHSPVPFSHNVQLEVQPRLVRSGQDNTPGRRLYINLEAKPVQWQAKWIQFLRDILAGVSGTSTRPRLAPGSADTTFGICASVPRYCGTNAHDGRPGGQNFLRSAELEEMLANPAHVNRLDVISEISTLWKKIA